MNYATLLQTVQDYLESSEPTFVSYIPTFVELAENRIFNEVQMPAMRENLTGYLTAGNKYLALQDDYLAVFSLAVIDGSGNYNYMLDKDVNYIRQAYPSGSTQGMPLYFGQFDPYTLILGPTPDQPYQIELHQYYYPPSIVTAGTSWLGDNFEQTLLYGTLREAAVFQKAADDLVANYEAKYQEGLKQLKRMSDGLERRSAYRDGQLRIPVS